MYLVHHLTVSTNSLCFQYILSVFIGPVGFSNKITSSSPRGIEATHLFLQGDSTVSRKLTVGIATPVTAGTPGDIIFFEDASQGENLGWVYTSNRDWKRFGNISLEKEQNYYVSDKHGVAIGAASSSYDFGRSTFQVGGGATAFAVTKDGVGIGTTNGDVTNNWKLHVIGDTQQLGNVNVTGILTAGEFWGNGSHITNLSVRPLYSSVTNTYSTERKSGDFTCSIDARY